MDDMDEFFTKLKESIETHSSDLKKGELFKPSALKNKVFSNIFQKVAQTLGKRLNLEMHQEVTNRMPKPAEDYGSYQRVDYVYLKSRTQPHFFLELESLDRAQLYLFSDIKLKCGEYAETNKLWYYLGTIKNHLENKPIPRYFVWLLILPDKSVADYSTYLWDIKKWGKEEEYILHPSLKELIFENPYRFYDHLIKTSARLFLEAKRENELKVKGESLANYQNVCELVFLTCTGDRLIISRGKDHFSPDKEESLTINWKVK